MGIIFRIVFLTVGSMLHILKPLLMDFALLWPCTWLEHNPDHFWVAIPCLLLCSAIEYVVAATSLNQMGPNLNWMFLFYNFITCSLNVSQMKWFKNAQKNCATNAFWPMCVY